MTTRTNAADYGRCGLLADSGPRTGPPPPNARTEPCAVRTDGTLWCCLGKNSVGQLGDGTTTDRTDPVQVLGGTAYTAVDAGRAFACVLDDAGRFAAGARTETGSSATAFAETARAAATSRYR